jgi:glycosyltransferase involved in cell wall biosynthesis
MPGELRILQLISDRQRRGAQVFAVDLAAGLRASGASVETVALEPGTHGDLLPVRALGSRRFGLATFRALRGAARQSDVVVAHGSSTLPASVLGLIGTHRPIAYRQISDPDFWASSWPRRLRVGAFLRRTKAVVATSEAAAAAFKRHYRLRSRPSVTVIPNAVPANRFRPPHPEERAGARGRLGLPADSEVVLFVGALSPEKGLDLAVAALAALETAVLVVVGDGPARRQYEALAADRLPGRHWFLGSLDDPQVAYWAADLFVLPSRTESMPAVLIEAGLCGLASVATQVGAVPEIVEDGVTGCLVPAGDPQAMAAALEALTRDPARRRDVGSAAAERCAAHFTIDRVAPQWVDLLAALAR